MKRAFFWLILFVMILTNCSPSFAYSHDKFKRGAGHIFNSPGQIREGLRTEPEKSRFLPLGILGGIIKGAAFMSRDIISGVTEIVTSPLTSQAAGEFPQPVPTPSGNDTGNSVTVNIPTNNGGYTPVMIQRSGNGFIGPQGEFYPEFPNVSQLKVLYGK